MHFRNASLRAQVVEGLRSWFEDGAPLGLTAEIFDRVFHLEGKSADLFPIFATDSNRKVDALEVLSAYIMLADGGSLDDRIQILFPLFDFSGVGRVNFDEVTILVQCVLRGLQKVCGTAIVPEEAITDACRRIFDASNEPYNKTITKEQLRRWLHGDVEAMRLVNIYQYALQLPALEVWLEERVGASTEVFSQLSASHMTVDLLSASPAFRDSLGAPGDEDLRSAFLAMMWPGEAPVTPERFEAVVRAWHAFSALEATGQVDAKEMPLLLRLQYGKDPERAASEGLLQALNLRLEDPLSRSVWMSTLTLPVAT